MDPRVSRDPRRQAMDVRRKSSVDPQAASAAANASTPALSPEQLEALAVFGLAPSATDDPAGIFWPPSCVAEAHGVEYRTAGAVVLPLEDWDSDWCEQSGLLGVPAQRVQALRDAPCLHDMPIILLNTERSEVAALFCAETVDVSGGDAVVQLVRVAALPAMHVDPAEHAGLLSSSRLPPARASQLVARIATAAREAAGRAAAQLLPLMLDKSTFSLEPLLAPAAVHTGELVPPDVALLRRVLCGRRSLIVGGAFARLLYKSLVHTLQADGPPDPKKLRAVGEASFMGDAGVGGPAFANGVTERRVWAGADGTMLRFLKAATPGAAATREAIAAAVADMKGAHAVVVCPCANGLLERYKAPAAPAAAAGGADAVARAPLQGFLQETNALFKLLRTCDAAGDAAAATAAAAPSGPALIWVPPLPPACPAEAGAIAGGGGGVGGDDAEEAARQVVASMERQLPVAEAAVAALLGRHRGAVLELWGTVLAHVRLRERDGVLWKPLMVCWVAQQVVLAMQRTGLEPAGVERGAPLSCSRAAASPSVAPSAAGFGTKRPRDKGAPAAPLPHAKTARPAQLLGKIPHKGGGGDTGRAARPAEAAAPAVGEAKGVETPRAPVRAAKSLPPAVAAGVTPVGAGEAAPAKAARKKSPSGASSSSKSKKPVKKGRDAINNKLVMREDGRKIVLWAVKAYAPPVGADDGDGTYTIERMVKIKGMWQRADAQPGAPAPDTRDVPLSAYEDGHREYRKVRQAEKATRAAQAEQAAAAKAAAASGSGNGGGGEGKRKREVEQLWEGLITSESDRKKKVAAASERVAASGDEAAFDPAQEQDAPGITVPGWEWVRVGVKVEVAWHGTWYRGEVESITLEGEPAISVKYLQRFKGQSQIVPMESVPDSIAKPGTRLDWAKFGVAPAATT